MSVEFSTGITKELLPFAQDGAVRSPGGDSGDSGAWFEITGIFENGLTIGDSTYTGLQVYNDGQVQFGNGQGYQQTNIAAHLGYNGTVFLDDEWRFANDNQPGANAGVWVEENSSNDSILITFSQVPYYNYSYNSGYGIHLRSYQIEILDRGDDDAEVIFRYAVMDTDDAIDRRTYFQYDDEAYRPPLGYIGALHPSDWDEIAGNTGVDGVWQFRFEDGALNTDDLRIVAVNATGDDTDDLLIGSLSADILRGLGGNDTIEGDLGNDTITGDAGDDSIDAGGGNDDVFGGTGNDTVDGGRGNDTINVGDGDDSVFGGDGNDLIQGGTGDNTINGGEGNDTITVFSGDDLIVGGGGNDSIETGSGTARVLAGGGNDRVNTGFSDDNVVGGHGSDTINTFDGNDTIDAGGWNDTVHAGEGDNLILGGWGRDYLTAGAGVDRINGGDDRDLILSGAGDDVIFAGNGRDTAYGGEGNDLIVAETAWYYDRNVFYGMEGNDSLIGAHSYNSDTLLGGAGDDQIRGRAGNDLLAGGEGNDTLLGEDGNTDNANLGGYNDTIFGGAGEDSIFGGLGNDSLDGNTGNDTITGGDGNDLLNGGVGDDFLFGGLGEDTMTGGPGGDIFYITNFRTDVSTITDYNADDGDMLVMASREFERGNLRLVGDRLADLDGNAAEFGELSLVRIGEAGGIAQTLYQFDNPSQIDRLVIRLVDPLGERESETIDFDLF